MKKLEKNIIIYLVLFVLFVVFLTGCTQNIPFNTDDVIVKYQYNGICNEYNNYTEDELPSDKKAVSYTIKITNNSDYHLKNICRNHAIQGTNDKSDTQIQENIVEILPNSEIVSFPIYIIFDKKLTDEEILQLISQKKDCISFSVENTRYETFGNWIS